MPHRRFAAAVFLSAALLSSGCGDATEGAKQSPLLLPSHIRKIAVRPIANKTQFFGLEEKLRLRVEEEFIRDGRLPYVNDEAQADGIVVGEIVRYIKEPISYDNNHIVEEYKLWVIMNLYFIDAVNKVTLWQEPRLEQEYRYFVETKPGGVTEEEARELLWELFARDIVKRTIEGFGSVSGASQREIADDPVPGPAEAPSDKLIERTAPPSPY